MSVNEQKVEYVVAVSGGVDSVVLLDIMAGRLSKSSGGTPVKLLVAHFDHGIRADSGEDRLFVEGLARKYDLPFVAAEGHLGPRASEAAARQARYDFLRMQKAAHGARAIVTAHHEDDVLETALLNIMRGTGRKGLSSLKTTDEIYRPLLMTPKAHIQAYASRYGLEWREDSTNLNTAYLRNYIRHEILTRFDAEARAKLRQLIGEAHVRNVEIDRLLAEQLQRQSAASRTRGDHLDRLDRNWFIMLPHAVSREIMAAWLRRLGVVNFDRKLLERLTVAAKTYAPGKRVDVNRRWIIIVGKDQLVLSQR